jgi:hypothetical protein
MDHQDGTTAFDQADEDILTPTVDDAALEAAAGRERAAITAFSCRIGVNCW